MTRSACPKCQTKMTLAHVTQGPLGFEHQSFECRACDHTENIVVALDPAKPNSVGWLPGEFKPLPKNSGNAVTHTVVDGRMMPRPAE